MVLEYSVVSVKSSKSGNSVKIEVKVGSENKIFTVSDGTYREIGCPLSDEVIDTDTLVAVEKESRRLKALQKALRILSFADNNRKNLQRKLIAAGFTKEESDYALGECLKKGFIDEDRQLLRLIEKMANSDRIGPYKISAKLAAKGYSPFDIRRIMTFLSESGDIDFKKNANALFEKLRPESYDEKQKILYKYGYKR